MNAVDRFSNTLARYRQLPQPVSPGIQSVPQPFLLQPVQAAPRTDVERALDKVAEVTPLLSRLAMLVNRVQNPQPAAASINSAYPSMSTVAPGALGQSLQRLGQAVGNKDVDRFVRQAAPVIDDVIPLIEGILNLASGKPQQPVGTNSYQASAVGQPSIAQQVTPIVEGISSLVSALGSLFKR